FVEAVRLYADKRVSNGGSIVVMSSYSSINGDKGQLAYSASKSAIDSSVVVMSKELYSKNIRVNAIRPAIIQGEDTNIELLPVSIKNIIEKMKIGLIDPNILAEQVAFLISDYSSGVYGRCFDVKGYLS
ncbi:SDR family oxidoreductase, partial [Aliarcobacter butzleri]